VACFLTRMKGGFEGYNERVDLSNYSGPWYWGGYSAHSGVGASARCLYAGIDAGSPLLPGGGIPIPLSLQPVLSPFISF
jgi:hypothetical protein